MTLCVQYVNIGLAEDDEQITLACALQVFCHMEIGVHSCLENRHMTQLLELAGWCIIVESARYEHVKVGIACFTCGINKVHTADCSELGAYEDCCTFWIMVLIQIDALGTYKIAWPWFQ